MLSTLQVTNSLSSELSDVSPPHIPTRQLKNTFFAISISAHPQEQHHPEGNDMLVLAGTCLYKTTGFDDRDVPDRADRDEASECTPEQNVIVPTIFYPRCEAAVYPKCL